MFLCKECLTNEYFLEFSQDRARKAEESDFEWRGKSLGRCENCGKRKLCVDVAAFHKDSKRGKLYTDLHFRGRV